MVTRRSVRQSGRSLLNKWWRRSWLLILGRQISTPRLEKQIKDFCAGARMLAWQRQGMYIGAGILTAFYYNLTISLIFIILLQLSEWIDMRVVNRASAWADGRRQVAERLHNTLLLTSTLSSLTVAGFTIAVAHLEGPSQHLTPLFFLFAAGLFAAVNNHQLPRVLLVRLVLYGLVFIYIPARDLMLVRPGWDSTLWLQLVTVIFVLFFVIECSRIFLLLYRTGLDQLDDLRKERDRARAALEIKSQFVSVVSHELRTPLTSIHGSLSVLRTGAFADSPERTNEIVDIAFKNSKRLSDLINDLLDLQKIESGQMRYDFAAVDLCDLINEAVGMMHGYSERTDNAIRVNFSMDELFISADAGRMTQVLTNLMSNAIKFSKPGHEVVVSVHADGETARVEIQDFGIGIPPNSREMVFGKFTQVDGSDHRSHQGSGLGLNITEKIVLAHGGTIDYVSTPDVGTTFSLEFERLK